MFTNRADIGGFFADNDVTTVAALPDGVSVAAEYKFLVYIVQELAVAFFVLLFLVQKAAGWLFTRTEALGPAFNFLGFEGKQGGYFLVFCCCGVAYLLAWIIMKSLVPEYRQVKI